MSVVMDWRTSPVEVLSARPMLFLNKASCSKHHFTFGNYFSGLGITHSTPGTLKRDLNSRCRRSLSIKYEIYGDRHREQFHKAPLSRNIYQSKSSMGVVSSFRTYARAASLICSSKRSSNSRRDLGRGQRDKHSNHHLGRKKKAYGG